MYLAAAQNLKTLIATTSTWQTLVGATGNAAQKLAAGEARIFLFGHGSVPTRPFIVIDPAGFAVTREGMPNTFATGGTLAFRMELARPSESTWQAEFASVTGSVDNLVTDMMALAASDGMLCISRIQIDNHNRANFVEETGRWSFSGTVDWP